MTTDLREAIENLNIRDADDQMDSSYVRSLASYQLLEMISNYDHEILYILLYNLCQRVIPGWELNCNNQALLPTLFALKRFVINTNTKESLVPFNREIKSPKRDCSYSDSAGASGTLFYTTKYILTGDLIFATYALSDSQIANSGPKFLAWFKETAIPVSFNKQLCNHAQTIMNSYPDYKEIYEDLFKELEEIH